MDDLARERDFYRQQCNDLGARVLRLQEEQTRAWRAARRSRTTSRLIREVYRLADSQVSLDEIGQRFLQIIQDTLSVDRVALLRYFPEQQRFVAQHTFGFPPANQPSFSLSRLPGEFHFVNSTSEAELLPVCLRQAAGVPYLLWNFDVEAGLALLVGNAIEDQHLHRPFEADDQEIIESALSVFIELTERKRAENLAAISRLALKLVGAAPDINLLELIVEELKSITGALATGVSIYNPRTRELVVKQIACSGQFLSTVNKLIGQSIIGMRIPVSPELLEQLLTEVIGEPEDLSAMTFGTVPKPIAVGVQQALRIGEIRGLALADGDGLLGTAIIVMPKGRPSLQPAVLKIFAHVATGALQRKQAENRIKASLKEKEVLLQEIHHRVKNNLQIVSSLLNLQTSYLQDQQTLEILQDTRGRIRSMALIHEKLYQSANLAQVDFGDYIRDLASHLLRSHDGHLRAITLNTRATDIFLDVDVAVPCGFIINEVVSNSLKHAFPNGQSGEIWVKMWANDHQQMTLIVGDNGIGFPQELDFRETESLGLQLVNSLVEQLEGTIELDCDSGANFTITFALPQRNN